MTIVKVKGKWVYLYRAVDKSGNTMDFYLSRTCNDNTDKNSAYGKAINALKDDGKHGAELQHMQVKYLNNIIAFAHGKLKRLIKPTLGFKSMKTAYGNY